MVEAGKGLGLNQGNAIVANIHNLGLLEALQRLVSQAAQPVVLQVKEANLGNGKYYIDAYQITATRNRHYLPWEGLRTQSPQSRRCDYWPMKA